MDIENENLDETTEEIFEEEIEQEEQAVPSFQELIEAEKDKYLRLYAEFDNFRKRTVKEKTEMYNNATVDVIAELLPVLDSFERAANADSTDETYKKGVVMLLEQFKNIITKIGAVELEPLGEDFDPNFHNAIKTVETDEFESGKVCQVFQKGFKYKDKLIRPAMVGVSQ
ncbi:nucleotide exchange factor GrpE [Clostridia bacterium]|nr:nucleotide exchange factor GrpE [Clostridia bacterium]